MTERATLAEALQLIREMRSALVDDFAGQVKEDIAAVRKDIQALSDRMTKLEQRMTKLEQREAATDAVRAHTYASRLSFRGWLAVAAAVGGAVVSLLAFVASLLR